MQDSFKHKGLRNKLVLDLKTKGINDDSVLEAIKSVPRHLFMDSGFLDHAYQDKAFPISSGQTISQPFTVAFQTELLNVKKDHKILEIGTGSGYQAAILCHMGAKVYTIERIKELFRKTSVFLPSINYRPKKMIYGDGYVGYSEEAPYDSIIVTAGASEIPEKLINQLKIGGRMVIPVGDEVQKMKLLTKLSESDFETKIFGDFQFVP
ncbi:MAG: protein-L-isoaspartate(D-aspartate) O-methyltransferase, partial [Flavobacteriaceae bacterium]|nr:protein-L-isoaspartate(D-aspartate) O-methyltransferase [Flavobacteriaceae bacterium]